ncbi:type I methionyl aminopeptidase [candidate division WOR-3 bacterium]|nr:type I methionyl aminopeptidase [candidate division WOR-3 bacterium]
MIRIRRPDEIELIHESGQLVAGALDLAGGLIRPGITTGELDKEIERYTRSYGASPEFKGYQGYPASICASVNEEVVHGIPGSRVLEDGDIVGIDVGVRKHGYVADGARTFGVGHVSEETERLVRVTREALDAALAAVGVGVHLSDVSHAVQRTAEGAGYSVVRELAGHGVGTMLHEPPEIPNYGEPGRGPILERGMILAIEPMVNAGGAAVETLADGWTVVTSDRKLSAHFEHTVAVTPNGADILTSA